MIEIIRTDSDALNTENIGETFKRLRTDKGMTLTEISEKTGLSLYTMHCIEKGRKKNPTLHTMASILGALGYRLEIVKDD